MPDRILLAMGHRLRELRLAAGLKQEQLAAASKLTAKYISQLENGGANPSLEVLHAIAEKGLSMPLAAFFAYDTGAAETRDAMQRLSALVMSQPATKKKRILRVIQALVDQD